MPISNMIASAGYQATFIRWGIIQGAAVVIAALFLKAPAAGRLPKTWRSKGSEIVRPRQSPGDFTSPQMFATKHLWARYLMITMVACGGLMSTAQLAPLARDFNVETSSVNILGWTVLALPFALAADRVINGLGRPFWGWVSDHIGRENTMALAFSL